MFFCLLPFFVLDESGNTKILVFSCGIIVADAIFLSSDQVQKMSRNFFNEYDYEGNTRRVEMAGGEEVGGL